MPQFCEIMSKSFVFYLPRVLLCHFNGHKTSQTLDIRNHIVCFTKLKNVDENLPERDFAVPFRGVE